jgi:PKD repeat protein
MKRIFFVFILLLASLLILPASAQVYAGKPHPAGTAYFNYNLTMESRTQICAHYGLAPTSFPYPVNFYSEYPDMINITNATSHCNPYPSGSTIDGGPWIPTPNGCWWGGGPWTAGHYLTEWAWCADNKQYFYNQYILSYGVPPAPVVDFSCTPLTGKTPQNVSCYDKSTGSPASWDWNFGDGGRSTNQNVFHTYTTPGTYTVNLTVTNAGGSNTTVKARYITVTPGAGFPIVKFTANISTGQAPLAVKFTDQSTGTSLKRWNWSFGDGNWLNTTISSQKSVVHTYKTPGNYTARLTVCNAIGCNTTVPGLRIMVIIRPIVKFTPNVSSGFAPLPVGFTDQSTGDPTQWNWSFGNGKWFNTTTADQKSPTYNYTTPGTYSVKLMACNAAGCNTTSPGKQITVKLRPLPTASFKTNVTSGNAPLAIQFTDTSTGKSLSAWNWNFGDGTWFNTTVAARKNPVHVYNSSGMYTAALTVSNASGSNTTVPGTVVRVTGKTSPIAVNVLSVKPGDDEYNGDSILNSANIETAMGYNPTNIDGYASNVRETIRSLLPNDHILLINGHSAPGKIQVNKQNDEWYYGKALLPGEYAFNDISSYANMDLAIFLGCNSGKPDFTHGNLVDVIGDKKGRCAMGWKKELNIEITPYYNTLLWNHLQQSETILNSHFAAIDDVSEDGGCQHIHQTKPNIYNEFCNQDALYFRENNNGCHVALSGGIPPAILSSLSVQTNKNNTTPSTTVLSKSMKSINQFTKSSVTDVHYTATIHKSDSDIYEFESNQSIFRVNDNNNRVQSARWLEEGSKNQKEIITLDQGYTIAESFAREKYNEFWKISDTRGTKIITKNVLDRGGDRELQYEWWEIYYASEKNTTRNSEIPGLNSVSVTISPYTGHVVRYSEIYTPSVVTGISPVNLSPTLTEEQAEIIAEMHFQTLGVPATELIGPEPLGLRISSDKNNYPHLVWNFEMIKTQKIGPKGQEFENKEYAFVSIDAHDGTVVWSAPFG